MTPSPQRRRAHRAAGTMLGALALALAAVLAAAPAHGASDPSLDQTIDQGQPVVHGARVLTAGHVDLGPRLVDGQWRFLVHDDVARADANATSVWRHPEETVLRIGDRARLAAPDDPAYGFLGVDPGSPVWVSPQTQDPEVVWIGWNTQDPEVMAQIDRGVTLTLHGVQGPGAMSVFLQSGSFGAPQLLWDSTIADPQPVWVEVNTHTHANWAFTAPGVYLVRLEASAQLIDGSTVRDTRVLRMAVGDQTDPASALAATWQGGEPAPGPAEGGADDAASAAASAPEADPLVPVLVVAIAVVAAGLVFGLVAAVVRGRRAQRRALAASAPSAEDAR